jgi:hypothetical protein
MMARQRTPEEAIRLALEQNGPYTHNIIGLALSRAHRENGEKEVKRLIRKFRLGRFGYTAEGRLP